MRRDSPPEHAFRRRIAILTLLHTGPCTLETIITSLTKDGFFLHDHALDAVKTAQLQKYQLEQDIEALRVSGCDIRYERKNKWYRWRNSPFGLSLDDKQLTSFAILFDAFTHTTMLHGSDIQALLSYLVACLPAEQQRSLARRRRAFSIDLHETTDYRNADPLMIKRIEQAIQQGQQLEFSHRRPRDGQVHRHVIEPRPLVYERGHVYLKGWSLDFVKELSFRLDYILPDTARVLPTTVARSRPAPRTYTLRYWLSVEIARNSVSEHFEGQHVEHHEDGSATVTAQITDLFKALRTLIGYREHCIVLDPPELVEQMRKSVAKLYDIYHTQNKTVQSN